MRVFGFVSCLLALPLVAQVPTIEQSLSFRSASGPRISPDGRLVAYLVQDTNWEDNSFDTQIWIYNTPTQERYPLTSGKKSASNPEWAPDSRRLAFLSDRDGKRQIYLISPSGGEAIALTRDDAGVTNFQWSRDGKHIAYTAPGPDPKTRKERKDKYGEFEVVQGDYRMSQLWVVDVPAESASLAKDKPKADVLTEGQSFSIEGFEWSPDSQTIAFTAGRDPDLSSSGTVDLYTLQLATRQIKKLVDWKGPERNPIWSPDGKQLAFETANQQEYYYYKNSRIAVIAADGGAARVLSAEFDENPRLIGWGPQGIFFQALSRTRSFVYRIDAAGGAASRVLGNDTLSVASASFTPDFKKVAFEAAAPNEFFEIYSSDLEPFQPRVLSNVSDQYKPYKLATRELIRWRSNDGTEIEGVLIKPATYDPAKKYPLLVVIHGGPTGIDRPYRAADRYYPVEQFAAKGALILRPNYRGSAGYGEAFRSLNVRNLGVGDAWDVLSGVEFLASKGLIDPNRVGAMGWSQGGYISAFLTCSSDRFRAISVGAGISDWMTYYVNTDIHPFTRQYLQATPWSDPDIYKKTSPISYVKSARTPTLIQHGELDKRVPIPNAYELHQALQDLNVPVKLYVYKGFGHGITKPKEQRHIMEQNYEWFSKWVWE